MRRLLVAVVLACFAGLAGADEVWLKDGRRIVTKKPLVQKGSLALLTTTDGVLLSIPLSEIDLAKTAAEKTRVAVTPVPTASVPRPLTPAEAAKQKGGRRAAVVLTDDSVAHGIGEEGGERKEGEGEGRVDVANTSATKTKDGYSFSGSVINSGASEVSGVSVTVEVVGRDGKTSSSAFAQLAKDTLAPGEKSTFTASTSMEGEAASYKYVPRWQVRIPVKTANEGAKAPGGSAQKPEAEGGQAPAPTPPPAPTTLIVVPRPDVAAPAANAPTGNPANGTFIPQTDMITPVPKPPGT
jgi:hypothetical protein